MPYQNDIAYHYDGSYEGFLCCVFRAVYEKEEPAEISSAEDIQLSLFRQVEIETEPEKARRVEGSIRRLGPAAESLIKDVFCSCMSYRESALLSFLRFAYRTGNAALQLAHPLVAPLLAAQKALLHEGHLFKEFLRFSDHEGVLVSIIEPKNFVLPYICTHFVKRYPNEQFFIWDKTHRTGLVSDRGRVRFFPLEEFTPPPVTREEGEMRRLWKQFYDTIAIKARENPRCRMTHMPKRFWSHLPELCEDGAYEAPAAGGLEEAAAGKPSLPVFAAAEKGAVRLSEAGTAVPQNTGTVISQTLEKGKATVPEDKKTVLHTEAKAASASFKTEAASAADSLSSKKSPESLPTAVPRTRQERAGASLPDDDGTTWHFLKTGLQPAQLEQLHTTPDGAKRIQKNLELNSEDVIPFCRKIISQPCAVVTGKGKNLYVEAGPYFFTIQANTLTVITAKKDYRF